MQTRAIQEKIRHVDVRALQRTRFIRNEVTGNVKTEQVHYEHGDLLVSCYMTRDIAEVRPTGAESIVNRAAPVALAQ